MLRRLACRCQEDAHHRWPPPAFSPSGNLHRPRRRHGDFPISPGMSAAIPGGRTQSIPMTSADTIGLFDKYVIGNYKRFPVCLVRGEGSYVWDAEGKRYLDLFPGWGCDLLGHCPPRVVEPVREQVGQLIHVPNTWYTEPQGQLAQALSERTDFAGQCFFCNSGAEANEAAIKLARLNSPPGQYKIITMLNSFH